MCLLSIYDGNNGSRAAAAAFRKTEIYCQPMSTLPMTAKGGFNGDARI
jgi:hypothetical protein